MDTYGVNHISYADDFTLYVRLTQASRTCMSECTTMVASWFMHNDLLLNPSKSETMTTGTRAQLGNVGVDGGVDVAGAAVSPASHMRIMGVTLDSRLSFDKHIADIVRIAFYHLRGLQHIYRIFWTK